MLIQGVYAVVLVIGLSLAFLALKYFRETQQLLSEGIVTKSTVIQLIPEKGHKSKTVYRPVFEYYDMMQKRQEFAGAIASSPAPFAIGDIVKIVYNPNDMKQTKVYGFWGLYRWTTILLAVAAPFLIIGGGYALFLLYQK